MTNLAYFKISITGKKYIYKKYSKLRTATYWLRTVLEKKIHNGFQLTTIPKSSFRKHVI